MSGGSWNSHHSLLADELFGWGLSLTYGKDRFKNSKVARNIDPMEDKELSEMLWDILCLLHSKDYYESGDINKSTYEEDVAEFKKKWFKRSKKDTLEAYKEDLRTYAEELLKEFK